MSPPVALPVPLVGSKPLPSLGMRAVSVPPASRASLGPLDGGAVTCTPPGPAGVVGAVVRVGPDVGLVLVPPPGLLVGGGVAPRRTVVLGEPGWTAVVGVSDGLSI